MYSSIMDAENNLIEFCTLAMFIIDDIEFTRDQPRVRDIIGGAGSYAALGARLFSAPPKSTTVAWIIDCGHDFPHHIKLKLLSWKTSCFMRYDPNRLTTRALNTYGENEYRGFEYLTPKVRIDANDLPPNFLRSKSFHIVCSAARAIEIVKGIRKRREVECVGESLPEPIIIWEPVPDLCTPENLQSCFIAANLVNIISPNHMELASLFSTHPDTNVAKMEEYCNKFLTRGISEDGGGSIVVRRGKDGCYATNRQESIWLPAFHKSSSEDKVKDPTGGGNTFLGGLAIALARGQTLKNACVWASVAASFAIEQIGMPEIGEKGEEEIWNGENVWKRIDQFSNTLL